MLHPKTTLPPPVLLALCWKAFGSVIYLFFSLGKWGKGAGFAFLARRCTEAPAEPSAWCTWQSWAWSVQGFLTLPGLMWKDKSDINLLEEESCSWSPAACSMCVMISWSESLSHRPRRAHAASGSSPNSFSDLSGGKSWHSAPPVLQLGRVLPGHTSASLWRYKWWMGTNPLYQNKHPK